jgi:hypothetical protein
MANIFFQHGSLRVRRRARGEPVWQFRYRVPGKDGRRILRSKIVGTLSACPTAEAMREKLRGMILSLNLVPPEASATFNTVMDRFIAEEHLEEIKAGTADAGALRHSTASVYLTFGSQEPFERRPFRHSRGHAIRFSRSADTCAFLQYAQPSASVQLSLGRSKQASPHENSFRRRTLDRSSPRS